MKVRTVVTFKEGSGDTVGAVRSWRAGSALALLPEARDMGGGARWEEMQETTLTQFCTPLYVRYISMKTLL